MYKLTGLYAAVAIAVLGVYTQTIPEGELCEYIAQPCLDFLTFSFQVLA